MEGRVPKTWRRSLGAVGFTALPCGFWVASLVLPPSVACGGKDECPDLIDVLCVDVGIEEESGKAYCDECGEVWVCSNSPKVGDTGTWWVYDLGRVGVPCTCINEDGYLDLYDPEKDTGDPYDWDPDCWVEY